MGKLMTAEASRLAFGELVAAGLTPGTFAQHKLDRLLELRAIVDALRVDALRVDALRVDALRTKPGDALLRDFAVAERLLRS